MDKQTKIFSGMAAAVFTLAAIVVFAAWTYSPDLEPSPFEINETPTPTPSWSPFTGWKVTAGTPVPEGGGQVSPFGGGAGNNETGDDDKSAWDVCDDRHNASFRYMNGCWGGGSSRSSPVQDPIPELPTFALVSVGLLGIWRRIS